VLTPANSDARPAAVVLTALNERGDKGGFSESGTDAIAITGVSGSTTTADDNGEDGGNDEDEGEDGGDTFDEDAAAAVQGGANRAVWADESVDVPLRYEGASGKAVYLCLCFFVFFGVFFSCLPPSFP
jgi:hypothetical protein